MRLTFHRLFPSHVELFNASVAISLRGTSLRKEKLMQLISTQNIAYLLVGIFSLCLASLAIAAPPHGPDGGHFEQVDANDDGVISPEEFQAKRSGHFSSADKDGAAGLSFEEFTALQEQRENERRIRRAKRAFKHLDTNSDGIIDDAEFAVRADHMFERLDANDDGNLSQEEMKQGRKGSHHGMQGRHGASMGYHRAAHREVPPPPIQ